MFLTKLSLIDFRNISKLNICFDTPVTIFYGINGQGKTNIVESIYLLSTTNSFRSSDYKEMIANGCEASSIIGSLKNSIDSYSVKTILNKSGKAVYYNSTFINKISDYLGSVNVVAFSPEDVYLFKDAPKERRSFLDKELSSLFPQYVKYLLLFKKVLEERNTLLKKKIDYDLLSILDDKLIESSYEIYKSRKWFIDKLCTVATTIYQQITDEKQKIRIEYETFVNESKDEDYFKKASSIYKSFLAKDIERSFTNVGIHKDDFKVFLNDLQIDSYASQGQQRLISLCLKLAVLELISKVKKEEPILVLDDAFSELDALKKEKLFKYVSNRSQVFITCTDYRNVVNNKEIQNISIIKIENGNVTERSCI